MCALKSVQKKVWNNEHIHNERDIGDVAEVASEF